jgi:UDP-N-acetylglucosamine--N-acetylmuramyl-(pentapeptide) pyrophosphoryl-undecaprenol N-acetylglucosamine transferase
MALVSKNAALIVKDSEAKEELISKALELIQEKSMCERLKENIKPLGKPNATEDIVNVIETII